MSRKEKMPRIERQLRLYEIVCQLAIVQFEAVCEIFPYNMRLLQRDLADLRDAGLVSVKYSRKGNGYVKTGKPEFAHKVKPCKMAHLKRLNRLGTLMSELVNEDSPVWEKKDNEESGDVQEYVTAKDSYNELFPGLSERTRQRDFEVLRRIGYNIFYDPAEHCFCHDDYCFPLGWTNVPDKIDDDFVEGTW